MTDYDNFDLLMVEMFLNSVGIILIHDFDWHTGEDQWFRVVQGFCWREELLPSLQGRPLANQMVPLICFLLILMNLGSIELTNFSHDHFTCKTKLLNLHINLILILRFTFYLMHSHDLGKQNWMISW